MIITLKKSATTLDEKSLASLLSESGLKAQIVKGELKTVVAVIGDTSKFDADSIAALPFVSDVKRITEPYRLASRTFCEKDTIVKIDFNMSPAALLIFHRFGRIINCHRFREQIL